MIKKVEQTVTTKTHPAVMVYAVVAGAVIVAGVALFVYIFSGS